MSVRLQGVAGATGPGSDARTANGRYGVAEAESLWLALYGRPAIASKIASELDAVFCMSEPGGGDYLLRIADNQDGIADLQAALLDHIAKAAPDLPVPRVHRGRGGAPVVALTSTHGDQFAAFATSFLPGKPLATVASSPATRSRIFALLAELDRSMSGLAHPTAKRSLLWDVSDADRIMGLTSAIPSPALRELVEHTIADWRADAAPALSGLRRQIIHNDFNPSNLLVSDDGAITGIIDFGDVIEAPLICDLATAIAYQEPKDGFDALIAAAAEAYSSNHPLTREEVAILPVLVRARAAMVVTITHWRATQNPGNRDYLLRNAPLASRLLEAAAHSSGGAL